MKIVYKVKIDKDVPLACYSSNSLNVGDQVIVLVDDAPYMGSILSCSQVDDKVDTTIYNKIIRKATDTDLAYNLKNKENDKKLIPVIQKECNNLKLDMRVFNVLSSFDNSKVRIMYVADNRVDFRELLKILARLIHAHIEMKQVGARDKAKIVGGLGVCGLRLCCSTFLTSFEGITIQMAKNQMLAINIPKLSGQCGKLICCLKYEDDAYVSLRKYFPSLGTFVKYKNETYKVSSINILSQKVTLNKDDIFETVSLDDYKRISKGLNIIKKDDNDEDLQNITNVISSTFNTNNDNKNNNSNNQKYNNKSFKKYNNYKNNNYQKNKPNTPNNLNNTNDKGTN